MTIEPEPRPAQPELRAEPEQESAAPDLPREARTEPQQRQALPEPTQDIPSEPSAEPIAPEEPRAPELEPRTEQGLTETEPESAEAYLDREGAPAAPQPPQASVPEAEPETPRTEFRPGATTLEEEPVRRRPWLRMVKLIGLLGLLTLLGSAVLFRFINPPFTTVMATEKLSGATLRREWVPLERISRSLPLAVVASEDGRFCQHWGVDWGAVRDAVKENRSGGFRGASTIPMQTAKNLYLWTERSYLRKLIEVPIAYLLSALWPKERVIEVYLNIAQWGPGIFGAEAASRYYFGKSASALTRREALLLAAALPAPRIRNPARPSARMLQIARSVERRMPVIVSRATCLRSARSG
jgi:monofunctional biosynthetic peptidoglycan transglycosylase